MSQTVEEALALIREDRPDATDRALSLLQKIVYSFSMKVCGHHQDAEDAMQEVLLKSIPHLAKFDNPRALKAWLYRAARNRCISNRRAAKFSPAKNLSLDELMPSRFELQDLLRSPAPGPEETLLSHETGEKLKQAIMAVPILCRMVLVLHDMEGLSTEEVAQIMSLREGTVRVRLHRGRLFLRRHLDPIAKRHAARGLDGVVDDAMCDEMDRHLHDCEPCQAFLASLKNAVAQCRSYAPQFDEQRAQELRKELLPKYQSAVAELGRRSAPADGGSTQG
jgi:RNA polymerase sigma-70 factor, ECF subfamily